MSLNGGQGVVVVAEMETTNMASILGASHCKNATATTCFFSNGGLSSSVKLVSFLCCWA